MKQIIIMASSLLLTISLFAQDSTQKNTRPTHWTKYRFNTSNLSDLDLSRSAILSDKTLESRKVNSLKDLNGLSPNLHLSGNGIKSFGDVLTMSGIGNTQLFGSRWRSIICGWRTSRKCFLLFFDLYDLEAFEVLKGPQGYNFGKSVTGGAINLVKTKLLQINKTNKVSASYATFNAQKYNISSSGPLDGDGFSYSLHFRDLQVMDF